MPEPAQQGAPTDPNGSGQTAEAGTTSTSSSFTQDDVNKIVSERVAKERKKFEGFDDIRKKAQQFDELELSKKTTEERLTGQLTVAQAEAQDAKGRLLRFEVAAAKDLPVKWATRLQGATKEALEADADELLKELKGAPARTSFDAGARTPAPSAGGMDDVLRNAARARR